MRNGRSVYFNYEVHLLNLSVFCFLFLLRIKKVGFKGPNNIKVQNRKKEGERDGRIKEGRTTGVLDRYQ